MGGYRGGGGSAKPNSECHANSRDMYFVVCGLIISTIVNSSWITSANLWSIIPWLAVEDEDLTWGEDLSVGAVYKYAHECRHI